ncbi:hypothetical protein BH09BAC1_BH09BAC1_25800 [soil metagenome]
MRYFLKALAISLGLFLTVSAHAQHCGYDEMHQYYLQNDPGYAQRLQQIEADAQQYQAQTTAQKRVLITIPIVVHVVHNGEAIGVGGNISDAQILSQIDVLNKDYRFTNADASLIPAAFQQFATDMEFEFCLAIRDPSGNISTGIDRINGGRATWLMSDVDGSLKPTTIWDAAHYLNIWTLQLGGANASTLGYSSHPGWAADVDGVVIQYKYFGTVGNVVSPFNKGRTGTHEIGHYLGLDHLWGLGEANVSACGDDDGVADTPIQAMANYNCPTFPKVSCSNGPNGDMFMNYMDYVNDACMFMFSTGQKARVNSLTSSFRSSLVNSTACTRYMLDAALADVVYPKTTVCSNTFRPLVLIQNEGAQTITSLLINMVVDQSNFIQKRWTGSLPTGQSLYVTMEPITLADGIHELNVYISNPNNGVDQLADNNTKDLTFTVTNQTGLFPYTLPLSEGFESASFPPTPWEISSIGGSSGAWSLSSSSGFGNSVNGAMVDFFTSNTNGQKQSLITPYFEVPFGKTVALDFSHAYARKDSVTNDSLNIYFSLDCGDNWVLFWSNGGIHLQTALPQNTAFVPAPTEWEKVEGFNLPQLQGQGQVRIKFEAVSRNGNNIYLDDINLHYWTVGIESTLPLPGLKLYPNPASKMVMLQIAGYSGTAQVEVYNLQGKALTNHEVVLGGAGASIDVSTLSPGLYLVKVTSQVGERYVKLVVE